MTKKIMRTISLLIMVVTFLPFTLALTPDDGNVSFSDLQQKRITGRIVDNNGNPLPGVNILEKGTVNGAISDANGNYALTVAGANSVLTFSFIGYITQEATVGTQTAVNITLAEAVSALDEIVVVGYSTQARKSLTGSVSTVDAAAPCRKCSG